MENYKKQQNIYTHCIVITKMEISDLLSEYDDETIFDVYLIMDGADYLEKSARKELENRTNIIRFTPSVKHDGSPKGMLSRQQMTKGTPNTDNPCIIYDDSYDYGNSFKETMGFLLNEGYDPDKIYVMYKFGRRPGPPSGPNNYFDTATGFHKKVFHKELDVDRLKQEFNLPENLRIS